MATPAFGAQAGTKAEPNNAALFDARRRQTNSGSEMIENIVAGSNCMAVPSQTLAPALHYDVFNSERGIC